MSSAAYIKYEPQYAICPGETIRESIEALGLTQKEFAARLGITEKHLITLINGDCALTNEMALKLEHPENALYPMVCRYGGSLISERL